MKILMLGNSFTSTNNLPQILAELTGAEVVPHTRGGARLAEHLNPKTRLGAQTQSALQSQQWDYVVLQEMSNGPITAPQRFFSSVKALCQLIHQNGATPLLYATWAYQRDSTKLLAMELDYQEMFRRMHDAYHQAAEENQALIADVGQQFYALSQSQNLYASDGIHPNPLGTQIAAQTIAAVIRKHKEEHHEKM